MKSTKKRMDIESWQFEEAYFNQLKKGDGKPNMKLIKKLRQAMENELTEIEKDTIEMYYFENKTQLEISKILGKNASTVCRNLKRGKSKLKKFLKYII